MVEKFPGSEGGSEEIVGLIEQLRAIHGDFQNPKFEEMSRALVRAHQQHPEWRASAAWHRLLGSTPQPGKPIAFDMPDESVSRFIKELAATFLSS